MKALHILGASGDPHLDAIARHGTAAGLAVRVYTGGFNDPLPEELGWLDENDAILSYRGRWVLPVSVIHHVGACLNVHPGPPEWRGVGCVNQALYADASTYGATAHYVSALLDSGPIVEVQRFEVFPKDTVASLLERTYAHMLPMAMRIVDKLALDQLPLYAADAWGGPLWTRKQLNELSTITLGMSDDEVARRVRATTFGNWRPTLRVGDKRYEVV